MTGRTDNILSIRSHHAKANETLRVHLRILLAGLTSGTRLEVFLNYLCVDSRIEVSEHGVHILWLQVFVERQGIVVNAYPRVGIAEVPESNTVHLSLVATEHAEEL